ncbi:hypothetical protein E2C01_062211 [Portunus trituberculatus]|uniref:Uncharacterized protein n=1 Tax=Portunus trituberculatus TaxID=210409 RepID=A0A5B7H5V2_PORTR|nr:hypothetical protein [Portunus trituberculatus]
MQGRGRTWIMMKRRGRYTKTRKSLKIPTHLEFNYVRSVEPAAVEDTPTASPVRLDNPEGGVALEFAAIRTLGKKIRRAL